MSDSRNTFQEVPPDLTDQLALRRLLENIIKEIDVIKGSRKTSETTRSNLEDIETRLTTLENKVDSYHP